jgi:HD-GYP domain-containing protein (c-di-GMP phosphodiesterase class II)/flagellar basal body-associated protein FliL
MAEEAGQDSGTEAADDPPEGGDAPEESETKAKRRVNRTALLIGIGMAVAVVLAVAGSFYFIEEERQREVQAWQVRLGIVADSRSQAVNEWVEQNFGYMRELSENASLQLYMSELAEGGEEPEPGKKDKADEDAEAEEEAASASYLRNLLIATAERTGFKAPPPVGEVNANIERVGVAGIGLVDKEGKSLVSTPDMPPLTAKIRVAVAKALDGEPAVIDVYLGASGQPTMGFVLPIFGIQDDADGAKGIGGVVGVRTIGKDLYDRLKQPGDTAKTTETYMVRAKGAAVQYLTPLADGTPALKRTLAADTPDLAGGHALKQPGGFAIKLDYAGTKVLAASRAISGVPWVLIRKISREEALSATDTRLTTMLVVFVLMIVGTTVTIIAVWRHGSSVRATQAAANMKVALERFENLSKFMRVVTNSQRNVIVAVDGETKYSFANETAAKEAGIPTEDMMGKSMSAIMGPIRAQAYAAINKGVLKNFERESHTLIFGDEDAEDTEGAEAYQMVQGDFVPLRGDRDFPPAVLMVLNDITELTHERRRSEKMLRGLINTLVSVVDRRDPFSANHSSRVAEVALNIAQEMGLDEGACKTVDIAGSLMNLGKIFISTELLTKTDDLTPDERAIVGGAYLVTVDLLKNVTFEGPVVETIRQLGETWDGAGPLGLKEEETLETARVLAVANAFVGMVTPRAYRGGMPFQKVADILMEETGTKLDRKAVTGLINFLENRGGNRRWAHFSEAPEEPSEDRPA